MERHLQSQQTSAGLWTKAHPHIRFLNVASYTSREKETLDGEPRDLDSRVLALLQAD